MSRRMLIDVVCYKCQSVLAREQDDATWAVKVLVNGEITDKWPELLWTCWYCEAESTVNTFDMFPTRSHGRVRVPTHPVV